MRHMSLIRLMVVAIAGLFVANRAMGQNLDSNLDPFQEIPPHNTPGYGSADLTLTGTTLTITAGTGLYADLLAGATSVVLADAPVGMNGPTIGPFNLDPGFPSWTPVEHLPTTAVGNIAYSNVRHASHQQFSTP